MAGAPVVALESSLIAQGLPAPHNLETAMAAEAAVRESGAVPATTALEDGRLVVGADRATARAPRRPAAHRREGRARATSVRCWRAGALASTTVSATMRIAHMAGIAVFATGGIGGVHRGAARSFDVSSDIDELAATPVAVVCSGAKSILDLPATLEMLETRRVPVVGLGVDELPAFYSIGHAACVSRTAWTAREEAAAAIRAHRSLPGAGGILIVQPPPADLALDAAEVEGWIADGLARRGGATASAAGRSRRTCSGSWLGPRAVARCASTSASSSTTRAAAGAIASALT